MEERKVLSIKHNDAHLLSVSLSAGASTVLEYKFSFLRSWNTVLLSR